MIVFHYKPEINLVNRFVTKRPVARVFFQTKNKLWVQFDPYIDSGADITLIPYGLGKILGLELEKDKIEQIGGIKGAIPVIYAQQKIRIGEVEFLAKIGWALIEDVPPLLGRADIFDRFNVTFKQKDDTILFEERN